MLRGSPSFFSLLTFVATALAGCGGSSGVIADAAAPSDAGSGGDGDGDGDSDADLDADGDSDGDGDGAPTCDELRGVALESFEACCGFSGEQLDSLVGRIADECAARRANDRIALDPANEADCMRQLTAAWRDCVDTPLDEIDREANPCVAAVVGLQAEGDPCAINGECAGDLVCAEADWCEATEGTCRFVPVAGEPCLHFAFAQRCGEGAFCDIHGGPDRTNVCRPQVEVGGDCGPWSDAWNACVSGAYCDWTLDICVRRPTEGETCDVMRSDCERPTHCDTGSCDLDLGTEGTCLPPLPDGEPCCGLGFFCEGHSCARDETCRRESICDSGGDFPPLAYCAFW